MPETITISNPITAQTTSSSDELLTAITGKNLLDIIQEMGNNQTAAMIIMAKHQQHINLAVIHTTYHLLKNHISAASLDMYLDTANGRFGLEGNPKLSLQKIANKWDMSRERIRQVESSILRLLRLPHHQQMYVAAIRDAMNS